MRVSCPKCRHQLDGGELNIVLGAACCRVCGEYFSLPSLARPTAAIDAPEPIPPSDLAMATHGDSLTLAVPEPRPFFQVAMTLLNYATVGILMYLWIDWLGDLTGQSLEGKLRQMLPVFPGLLIGAIFRCLVVLLNTNRVTLGQHGLQTTSQPLPSWFAARASLDQVASFEVSRFFFPWACWWEVTLRKRDGSKKRVMEVADREQGQHVVEALNAHLASLRASAPRGPTPRAMWVQPSA